MDPFTIALIAAAAYQGYQSISGASRRKRQANRNKKRELGRINELERRANLDMNNINTQTGMYGNVAESRLKRQHDDFEYARSARKSQYADERQNARAQFYDSLIGMGASSAGGIAGLIGRPDPQDPSRYLKMGQKDYSPTWSS